MRVLKWLIGVVCSLIIAIGGGGYLWLKSTVPSYDGRVQAPVKAKTSVYRDEYAVPYVLADNEADAMIGVGYAMAQDRLFQMCMIRRAAQGRLSEVLGPDMVDVDKLFLALTAVRGLDEFHAGMSPELKGLLEAFSKGVNLFIANGPLPLEFKVLGFEPRPWRGVDCLAVSAIMAWDLNLAWRNDLVAAAIAEKLGPEAVGGFFEPYPADAATIDQGLITASETGPRAKAGEYMANGGLAFLAAGLKANSFLGLGNATGSNSWVLSPVKTTTGAALLCNDMHLGFSQPAIWWECGIITDSLKVKGLMVPGVPMPLAGHNPDLAWGLTNVMIDDADFFIEQIKPDDPDMYRVGEGWAKAKKVVRTIPVKGGEPVEQVFRITRNGVIINDLDTPAAIPGGQVLAMRWSGQDNLGGADAFYGLAKATDWASFNRAVSAFGCPGQNFVMADSKGNIGWRAGVRIPDRRGGYDPVLPVEGWSGANGWNGYLPFDQQPSIYNPPSGYIATANNKSAGPDYPHYISRYWAGPERITRIRQMIDAGERFSPKDMKAIHMDVRSLLADQVVPYIQAAFKGHSVSQREAKALRMLADWDHNLTRESAAAAIFELTYVNLMLETVKDELGELTEPYLRSSYMATRSMDRWLADDHPLFDDTTTGAKETRDDIIRRALALALDRLTVDQETDNLDLWRWGKVHTLTFKHPFAGQSSLLDRAINLGPYPIMGGMSTVNPTQYRLWGDLAAKSGASMRHVIDFSDLDNSRGAITTGQSGHFLSPHYDDQVVLWMNGEPHPLTLDTQTVVTRAAYELVLTPTGN